MNKRPAADQQDYWRRNLRCSALLLLLWFVVTFGSSYYARELSQLTLFGFPLGYYMAAQGALLVYLAIVGAYALYMERLERAYGAGEDDD